MSWQVSTLWPRFVESGGVECPELSYPSQRVAIAILGLAPNLGVSFRWNAERQKNPPRLSPCVHLGLFLRAAWSSSSGHKIGSRSVVELHLSFQCRILNLSYATLYLAHAPFDPLHNDPDHTETPHRCRRHRPHGKATCIECERYLEPLDVLANSPGGLLYPSSRARRGC
jgi:hypothetical protein